VLSEHLVESVTGPLHTVKSFFGEHLQGTEWNFVVLLWVVLLTISLSQVGEHNLDVAFRSKSSRFDQRRLC